MLKGIIILVVTALTSLAHANGPAAYAGLDPSAYRQLILPESHTTLKAGDPFHLDLGSKAGSGMRFRIDSDTQHANGDRTIVGTSPDSGASIVATVGDHRLFGTVHDQGRHIVLTTDANGIWAVTLPETGMTYNHCGMPHEPDSQAQSPAAAAQATSASRALDHIIDLMVIYTPALQARYPGSLVQTRINHLVEIANITLANSVTGTAIRLVASEQVNYSDSNGNVQARDDMAIALSGGPAAPGLGTLNLRRNNTGADLVIMIRPHDIEIRGNCGVAFFPTGDPSLGVNLVSDGMSSWSLCSDDVLIHEIGHNLGAGHQLGAGGAFVDPRGSAFINPGQYTTVMGSFGTGRPDRFRGLPMFSNPDVDCGGQPCGSSDPDNLADNSAVIRDFAPLIAAYRNSISTVPDPVDRERSTADTDGDGVIDWDDHFPFDASEQDDADLDGVGDVADVFPNDPFESVDTDEDGQGNNQDTDDDGDQVPDVSDLFALDASESSDLDGDGVGDNRDLFDDQQRDFADNDQDGQGNRVDPDDDNDGVDELSTVSEDLLVISAGNNRILRFDAISGASRGIEVLPNDGLITFQSDLDYRDYDQTLLYASDSAIKRHDLVSRAPLGVLVQAFDDLNPSRSLLSGFPTGLAVPRAEQLPGRASQFHMGTMTRRFILTGEGVETIQRVSPDYFGDSGEEYRDIIMVAEDVIALGGISRSIYRTPSQLSPDGFTFLDRLSGPDTSWMQDPRRMALTDDGRLLITDAGRNSVVAIDAQTAEFIADLADIGAAGYSQPSGIVVNGNGDVLVAVAGENAVIRFDGITGDFLGEFISAGQNGLSEPRAMTLVPQWIDRYADDPSRVIRPNGGLWFSPLTNGRGFDIEVFGNVLTAIWYAYDEQGNPLWYYSQGTLDGFEYSGTLNVTRQLSDTAIELNPVGELSLTFHSERSAEMSYTVGDSAGNESLQWLEFSTEPATADYTGLWGRPDGPGWGITLATQGQSTVALAFIYDANGDPRWAISDPVADASPLAFEMFTLFSETLCPQCSGQSTFTRTPVGPMQIEVPDDGRWSSEVIWPAPLPGGWSLDQTELIRFSEAPERPR